MNVSKFSLINNGYIGIRVEAIEAVEQGNVTMLDHVSRTRRYNVSKELKTKINGLKYFFLNLTHHWIAPFNKYFDVGTYSVIQPESDSQGSGYMLLQTLMNHTEITGITVKNAGFCISGTIEVTEDKKIAMTTPFITEEDDVSFFLDAHDRIISIMQAVADEMTSNKAPAIDAREIAKAIKMHDIDKMNDEDVESNLIEKLQEKGFFVMHADGDSVPQTKKDYKLHTTTGSIDSHHLPVSKEVKEEKEIDTPPVPVIEKKNIGKGTLASEKNFPILDTDPVYIQRQSERNIPEGGTLEHLEFSENLGIPVEKDEIENVNQGEW